MNLWNVKSWFRRGQAPARLAQGWSAFQPLMPRAPAGYAEQLRHAMELNPVAMRCVRLVSDAVGGAPLQGGDGAILRLIHARRGGPGFLQQAAMHLLLHGNAYIQMIGDTTAGKTALVDLNLLRPERVQVVPGADGWPIAYHYRSGASLHRLPAEDMAGRPAVVHVRLAHPADDHYGLGCLAAASEAVAIHNAAAQWNHALLANAARPTGALVYDGGEAGVPLSEAQIGRLRQDLAEQFQGAANAGRPLLLEGGLKWQPISLSPAEMDYRGLKDAAARDIACAFGVPPMLVGIPGDATYANYREASKALWRQTVLPLADCLLVALNEALLAWGQAGGVSVDLDRVAALSEDRERLWAALTAADFLSPAEKRGLLELDHGGQA